MTLVRGSRLSGRARASGVVHGSFAIMATGGMHAIGIWFEEALRWRYKLDGATRNELGFA